MKWEGSGIENELIANQLIMQNEYWAAKCLERSILFICTKTAGQDKPGYLKYEEYSKSNKLPAIYKNARSLPEFIKSGATEGTLLLMNFQAQSKSKGPRFYAVEIPFTDWDKKKGTLKTKTGDTTIKISGNSVIATAKAMGKRKHLTMSLWVLLDCLKK